MPERPWEKVHTVVDVHDLWPLEGLADLDGRPHFYKRQFDEDRDEWSDIFLLRPADPASVAMELELWAIWQRWKMAFDQGSVSKATCPALPDERARYGELKTAVDDRQRPGPEDCQRMSARFRGTPGTNPEVQWIPVE